MQQWHLELLCGSLQRKNNKGENTFMENISLQCWIWFLMVFGHGSKKMWDFVNEYDSVEEAYNVLKNNIPKKFSDSLKNSIRTTSLEKAKEIIDICDKKKISVVAYNESDYPVSLKNVYSPPPVLFYQGHLNLLSETYPRLTVVGTRKPTIYSVVVADKICRELASAGIIIVSGFAVGLDSTAHKAALFAKGKTIAVMGCGLDVDYPKQNYSAKKYIAHSGLICSEFLPGTEPRGLNFPLRNRILSAISDGTLVIQAPKKSGALITASHAAEQGKHVFCIPPADIFDNNYAGVVEYLREGAIPVFDSMDILNAYYPIYNDSLSDIVSVENISVDEKTNMSISNINKTSEKNNKKKKKEKITDENNDIEPNESDRDIISVDINSAKKRDFSDLEGLPLKICILLENEKKIHADTLVETLGQDAMEVAGALTELCMKNIIRRIPGQYYEFL